jgi:hypothetical protein
VNSAHDLSFYNTSDKYYTAALPDLECENSGNYTIEVDNGVKDSVKKTINLVVQCSVYEHYGR